MNIDWTGIMAGGLLAGLLLLVGHWFPWERFVEGGLRRIEAYIYGTAALLAGFTLAAWLNDCPWAALWLAMIDVAGGLAVVGAYKVDDISRGLAGTRRQARRARYIDADQDE